MDMKARAEKRAPRETRIVISDMLPSTHVPVNRRDRPMSARLTGRGRRSLLGAMSEPTAAASLVQHRSNEAQALAKAILANEPPQEVIVKFDVAHESSSSQQLLPKLRALRAASLKEAGVISYDIFCTTDPNGVTGFPFYLQEVYKGFGAKKQHGETASLNIFRKWRNSMRVNRTTGVATSACWLVDSTLKHSDISQFKEGVASGNIQLVPEEESQVGAR